MVFLANNSWLPRLSIPVSSSSSTDKAACLKASHRWQCDYICTQLARSHNLCASGIPLHVRCDSPRSTAPGCTAVVGTFPSRQWKPFCRCVATGAAHGIRRVPIQYTSWNSSYSYYHPYNVKRCSRGVTYLESDMWTGRKADRQNSGQSTAASWRSAAPVLAPAQAAAPALHTPAHSLRASNESDGLTCRAVVVGGFDQSVYPWSFQLAENKLREVFSRYGCVQHVELPAEVNRHQVSSLS
ncbi:hypothetical protein ABBQ38_009990 [Trebouxia sp. C0009 RCD-2024]